MDWDDDGKLGIQQHVVYLKLWDEIPQREKDEGEEQLYGKYPVLKRE